MKKFLFRVLTFLLLVLTLVQPVSVFAAEDVEVDRKCSMELQYSKDGISFPGLSIHIYRVAELDQGGNHSLLPPFDAIPVKLYGIQSQKEWRDAANTMASYIISNQINPDHTAVTDSSGIVTFSDLETGLYLIRGVVAENDNGVYQFEDFFLFLPSRQSDGSQKYDMVAKPKCTSFQPKYDYQVTKLWNDYGIKNQRPKQVTVDILKNGTRQESVILSAENNWTHTWKTLDGNSTWTVVERDVPASYKVTISSSGSSFYITNYRAAPAGVPPKTGDSFALRPWLAVMTLSGLLLIACGILQKRRRK